MTVSGQQVGPRNGGATADTNGTAPPVPVLRPPGAGGPRGEGGDRSGPADGVRVLLRRARERPRLFVAILVAVPAVLVLLALAQGQRWVATATLVLDDTTGATASTPADADRTAATDRAFLELPIVARQAARLIGPGVSSDEVVDAVEVDPQDGDLVEVRASSSSPEDAVRTANAYANAYIAVRRQLAQRRIDAAIASLTGGARAPSPRAQARLEELRVARASETTVAAVAERAGGATPDAPPILTALAVGVPAGALLGLLIVALVGGLDRRLRSIEELEEVYRLPVIARIPRSRSLGKRGRKGQEEALSKTLGLSEEAEAFRALRTNLRYFNVDRTVKSMLVVSPLSGDGKSTIARYLAITMASMGDRVALVDADLRKSDAELADDSEGLSLVLAGFELDDALAEIPISFDVVTQESRILIELPSGPLPPNPGQLLESARMRWVISQLEQQFDAVIIDSPALVTVSDALTLVPDVSGVLIVSGFDRTTRQAAQDLRRQLDLLGGRPLGVVANFRSPQQSDYYYDKGSKSGR